MGKPLKNERIVVSVNDSLRKRMYEAEESTGVLMVHMLAKASESICNYVEKHKQIVMPFSVIPTQELEAIQARLAEVEALQARVTKLETENELLKSQGLNTAAPTGRSAHSGVVTLTASTDENVQQKRKRSVVVV